MKSRVYLSRRNLLTLLAKLDKQHIGGETFRTIIKRDNKHPKYPQTMKEIEVVAVEDENYYTHREPGPTAEDGDKEYLEWLKNLE